MEWITGGPGPGVSPRFVNSGGRVSASSNMYVHYTLINSFVVR